MIRELLLVGTGSAIGGIGRFLTGKAISLLFSSSFPAATFGINIAGSFLIGLFFGLQERSLLSNSAILFFATGICGGFTTFSTFSQENVQLLRQGQVSTSLLYMFGSLTLGMLSAYLGYHLTKSTI